ncbi:hypothetical protein DFO67_11568 [Modicisalibacter xianhensis]|uniref:Cthe-2314-like HEPN domain-containing protein n=1 Tax=Modicisalibacter xianhensis TaxID=442341 RepID=A0A4V3GTH9_9GAMM|nr:Cthe_2314 family HEPN domain-containing protein [Halomonas xianhensis]TDX26803.1 hypothetical protein DFO67_11568 [Halomonas xianhensis]
MHEIKRAIILDKDSPLLREKFSTEEGAVILSNEQDEYMFSCAKALSNLEGSIQKAKRSLAFLDLDTLEAIAHNDETRADLIELWVDNSIIRTQSIYERSLILVNRVCYLGIANERISHENIVCNEHVRKFGVDGLIKSINKKCKEYRIIRNVVIHHDRYSEEELDNISLILRANQASKENGGEEIADESFIEQITRDYLSAKNVELTDYLRKIEGAIEELYDSLIPIYQRKKAELGFLMKRYA